MSKLRKQFTKLTFGIIGGLISLSLSAQAIDPQATQTWYVGGGVGIGSTHCKNCAQYTGNNQNNGNIMADLHAGYQVNPYLSHELEVDWLPALYTSVNQQNKAYSILQTTISIKGIYPFNPTFSVFGKLGESLISLSENFSNGPSTGTVGTYYAVGAGFKFNSNFRVNLSENFTQASNFNTRFYDIYTLSTIDYLF